MFWTEKLPKTPVEPPAPTSLDEARLRALEAKVCEIQDAIIEICLSMREHLDRIDHNTEMLNKNMHNLAALTLRPPKDLLNGNNEAN